MRWRSCVSKVCLYCVFKDFVSGSGLADPSAGEARLMDKILKGFFSKPPCYTHEFPVALSLSLSLFLSLSLYLSFSFSVFAIAHLWNVWHSLPSVEFALDASKTNVQSTPALCSICLVAKCLALLSDLDLSKPVETCRRDKSFRCEIQ